MGKVYTPFQTKTTQKPALWTRLGIYLYEQYGLYKGLPPWGAVGPLQVEVSDLHLPVYHLSSHPPKKHTPPPQKNILLSSGFLSQSCYYLFQIDDCICIAS